MDASVILTIIIVIISADFLLDRVLDYLNLSNQKNELPNTLKGIYDEEKYLKSLAYNRAQTKFSFITSAFSFALAFFMLYGGGFGILDSWLRPFFQDPIILALAFFAVLFFASDIITIPFQWYSTFVLEEKFEFNKTKPKTFVLDKIKGYVLTLVLGGGILWILLYLINMLDANFWIYFWIVISAVILLTNMFYTTLIVPLFNKLTPLEDGELKEAIKAYSQKINFPVHNIFVIDGSKRSSKANAFFSGIGKKKKIVLYDTLIKNHSVEELVAVLAHEVGHYKKKHIIFGFIFSVLQIGVMLFIMSFMIFNQELSLALNGTQTAIHLNLIAFAILYSPISKVTGLLMNILSRKNEFEADAFATTTFNGQALQIALKKLSVNNLSNLLPHSLYVFFNYSHPPLLQRLEAIEIIQNQAK
ncbi:M48 family metallopeptidase [Fulvivirgaceae bacterium BMA10]|uniref:M48 family metallopeptidase n=1 Tax=Splendidivirga corallicola TaxID=3051826 RepID=A0ABT8KIE8_9BACT|nr:M48 family metallopeptidase [Fulvivirgaceae bacterium BMA10]